MLIIYIPLAIIAAGASLYFVIKRREFRKFLSGAFFISGGIQLYLAIANVSIPLIGTSFTQTPEIGFIRCIPHFIFSVLCFYFGFIRKPRAKKN